MIKCDGFAGAAYIYVRDGMAEMWVQAATLTASDGAPGAQFGVSVAVHSDTIVVGASGESQKGASAGEMRDEKAIVILGPPT